MYTLPSATTFLFSSSLLNLWHFRLLMFTDHLWLAAPVIKLG